MTRFTALTAVIFMSLVPLTATAGPPAAGGPDIPPVFESGSPSGIAILEDGGYFYGYNMDGLTVTGEGALPSLPAGYSLVAGAKIGWPDLDGNGISDVVIQHSGGYQYAYLMQDSGTFVDVLDEGAIPALPPEYTVLGWPDLDGDGDTDLVIQHSGGYTYAYLMNGLNVQSEGQVPGLPTATYSTIGFSNLDGLMGDDIVIQEDGGYTYAYLMNGTSVADEGPVPGLPTATYSTIGFPNLDDANGGDIVIQEDGGYTYAYLMNGLSIADEGQVPGLPTTTYSTVRWAESWAVLP